MHDSILLAVFLLQESIPPVMAFHLGSLGFLSPFEFLDYREKVDDVLQGLWHTHIVYVLTAVPGYIYLTLYAHTRTHVIIAFCTLWQKMGSETGFKIIKR